MRNTFLDLKLIIIFCVAFASKGMYAQLGFCSGNSGDPIFVEDFGTGTTNTMLPSGSTTYTFANDYPNDGEYTVNDGTFGNGFDWHQTPDHTPDDTNGKCMIIQAGASAGEFYNIPVSGLCENTTYEFSAWILNLVIANSFCATQPGGTIPINVRFEIWDDTDTNLLASGDTGNIVETSAPNWQEFGLVFQTLAAQNSVILKMLNNGAGGCGNDLAIDDIEFKTCGDLIAVEDSSANNSIELCSSQTPFSDTITAVPDNTVFSDHFYQWQVSSDGSTWSDVAGETNNSISVTGITTTTYYRTKVAEFATNLSNPDCITFSDVYQITINPNPDAPISDGDVTLDCVTNQVTLAVTVPGGLDVNWYDMAAGGTLLQPNSNTLTVTTADTYYAEAIDTGTGCVSTTRTVVNANASSLGDASFTPTATCDGATVTITGTLGGTFQFNGPPPADGAIIDSVTGEVTNGVSGTTYEIEYITSGTCQSSSIQDFTVLLGGDASFTPTATCDGATVVITGTSGGTFRFDPDPTDGAMIDVFTGEVTNGVPGEEYTIEYTTSGMCSVSSIERFIVLPEDDASFSITSTCDGSIALVTGLPGGTFAFDPDPMDGAMIDSATGLISNGISGTTYTVEYTTNGTCPSTSNQPLTVTSEINIVTPAPLEQCDIINAGDGVEVFDLTENEDTILNGETGVSVSYHEKPEEADEGSNPISDPENYTNIESPAQEIYVRVTRDGTDCYKLVAFSIIVQALPEVVAVTDLIQCELNTDGVDNFDLNIKDVEVLNGQDASRYVVSYHDSPLNAESGLGTLTSPYTNSISNPQRIYVRITDTVTGCFISTQSFNIRVDEAALANSTRYETCDDNMETDGNPSNDSTQFDLSTQDMMILDGQNPVNYAVSYYATEGDAILNVSPLPSLYENITNPQVIYARVDNDIPDTVTDDDSSICFAIAELTLQVNPLPVVDLEESYILCVDINGTEELNPLILDTGLSVTDYSFEWLYNGEVIIDETSASISPTQGGTYSVTVTDSSTSTVTSCINSDTTEVMESAPPLLEVNLVSQAFANNHVIEAVATGIGDYEYSLDDGPWQDSGTFINVSPGDHEVFARDKNGCGFTSEPIFVLDYPKYFTPNDDGNHDTWNIAGIGANAKIYIFDRYGKLLKQLSPTGTGWNGTYNGNMMPTSDYWFLIEYDEPLTGQRKEFKANFTLKH